MRVCGTQFNKAYEQLYRIVAMFLVFLLLLINSAFFLYCDGWKCINPERDSQFSFQPITTPSRFSKMKESIYYPWNDDDGASSVSPSRVDYDALCKIILDRVNTDDNKYTIINDGLWGGIGHKYTSVVYSLTAAIVLKRNLKSKGLRVDVRM